MPPWQTAGTIFHKTWVQCAILILASLFLGPACVAVSTKVLHFKYASLIISDLVVHFIIGLVIVIVVCFMIAILFVLGG
ncbi:hypothetical protein DL96DRAFT_1635708 [Flagelloscypha sp. PMI_526]|nr:hypothetical protein DL96DRAFT_1635708 [Flagelloscypha sp. PMI_526]